jgi:hypothetical protein
LIAQIDGRIQGSETAVQSIAGPEEKVLAMEDYLDAVLVPTVSTSCSNKNEGGRTRDIVDTSSGGGDNILDDDATSGAASVFSAFCWLAGALSGWTLFAFI